MNGSALKKRLTALETKLRAARAKKARAVAVMDAELRRLCAEVTQARMEVRAFEREQVASERRLAIATGQRSAEANGSSTDEWSGLSTRTRTTLQNHDLKTRQDVMALMEKWKANGGLDDTDAIRSLSGAGEMVVGELMVWIGRW